MGTITLPSDQQYKEWDRKGYSYPDAQFDTSTGLKKKTPGTEVRTSVDITEGITAEIPKLSATESDAASYTGTTTEKVIRTTLQGINNMIVSIPDAPLNALMEGLEKIGVVPENERSRDYLMRLFNAGDYETVRTIIPYVLQYGEGERVGPSGAFGYAQAAGEGLAAALPFIGVAGKTAQTLRTLPGLITKERAALTANPTALRILQNSMVAPYVAAPWTAASIEGGFASISGMGAKAEKDLFGTNTGGGALAPIVAPVVLAKSLGKIWTYSPTRRVASWLNPRDLWARGQDLKRTPVLDENMEATGRNAERIKTTVGLEMAEAYNRAESRANAVRARELEEIVLKDSKAAFLTTGEKTLDPVQLAREAALARGGDDSYKIKLLDRRHQIYDAMRKFYHNVVLQGNDPAGTDTPMFIQNTVDGRIEPLLKKVRSDQNEVADSLTVANAANGDAALFPSIETGTRAVRGATIRQAIENLYKTATNNAADYATKLGINSANEVADPTAFRNAQTAFKATGGYSDKDISYQNLPKSVKQFLQHKESLTFQDWKRFRDQVGDDIGSAVAKGQSTAVKTLTQLKSTLDNLGTEYGKINQDFQKFNQFYQETVAIPFQNNTVASVRVTSGLGKEGKKIYQISDESVAKHFLGNEEDAKSYVNLFSNDASKMEAIRAAALDEIRKNGGIDAKGILNPARINTWINKNGDVLQRLNLLKEFTDSSQLLANLSRRAAMLKNREEKITSNLVYKALMKGKNEGDPIKLLDAGLANVSTMRGLRNTVLAMARRDKDNANAIQEAWNRSVIERFMFKNKIDLAKGSNSGDGVLDFSNKLRDNESVLIAAVGKKQYQNLFVLSDLAARVQATKNVNLAGEAADSNMIQNMADTIGLSPQNISRSMLAYKEGRLSGKTLGVYFASRALGRLQQRRVQELWERALSDPELANLLTKEGTNVGTTEKPVWRPLQADIKRLNAYLFNLGYPYGDTPGVDPENRPAETITIKPGPQSSVAPDSAPVVQTAAVEPEQTSADILQQIVSAPSPSSSGPAAKGATGTSQMAELFPFDATSAAIERRKTANQIPSGGIQQLVG
jgi:hypothetical protein